MDLSVIICTHNPRMDYLTEALDALKAQTLPVGTWELLLVDNVSNQPLDGRVDLSWHPLARIVYEEKLGLTPARLRGIRETSGKLIVLVDDDNVLDPCYLENAVSIAKAWPILGAWGGQTMPKFEVVPPKWTERYWGNLAIRKVDRDLWSNQGHEGGTTPIGAGMVVRRQVAEAYCERVSIDEKRLGLDRKGGDLVSGGDIDLAFTAVDLGFGTGLFTSLRLSHLISADRLSEKHLLKLEEKITYSGAVLASIRGLVVSPPRRTFLGHARYWFNLLRMDARARRFELARRRGLTTALRVLRSNTPP